ncbi:conserved membrane protein of unknown function (plasmid) [Paraburkholderia dioscoreae]|uniref:Transmembrane protein n=2 Tax=Paraburkholderia dioscoreae TaxID=2604047 RepID=A0A5Q4ZR79_9BURK|nr:conserved membrane protein of unknown function [Paraburkholderia dioscoreae]
MCSEHHAAVFAAFLFIPNQLQRHLPMRNDATSSLLVLFVLAIIGGLFWISRTLGASFSSVCTATVPILFSAVILFAAWRFLDDFALPLLAGFFVIAWPSTWPVLDSIASGGRDTEDFFRPMGDPLINSDWVKWGVEGLLVGLLAAAIYARRRRRYW